ncbi:hypothetical protein U0C82_06815 [Fulvimarina sp. 2208YS6-2-32]|uniref:Uncharacterized protein n=1 Tax=Fulvimarina uroteuthidis TaxID=3098149 RepID=A0ABU5I0E6_9HYPH|nr:hypothetical protein [Fulvimarina sp. 2208YS6-2-32]MDY8108855.1 hypothetical protein [Fulvimarina sp. 2208YS6-2-32]
MIGNIRDHRTDLFVVDIDAVFEPTIHDNPNGYDAGPFRFDVVTQHPDYFHVADLCDTTVRDALLHAETTWPFPVTVYLYDAGIGPLG